MSELLEHKSTNESVEKWKEGNWLPSKMNQTALTHFYKLLVTKESAEDRTLAMSFVDQLVQDEGSTINNMHAHEAVSKILNNNLLVRMR